MDSRGRSTFHYAFSRAALQKALPNEKIARWTRWLEPPNFEVWWTLDSFWWKHQQRLGLIHARLLLVTMQRPMNILLQLLVKTQTTMSDDFTNNGGGTDILSSDFPAPWFFQKSSHIPYLVGVIHLLPFCNWLLPPWTLVYRNRFRVK